jgi:protein involved in polysaccharide export with SLBB domain
MMSHRLPARRLPVDALVETHALARIAARLALIALYAVTSACSSTPPGDPLAEVAPVINASYRVPADDIVRPGDTLAVRFALPTEGWDQESVVVHENGTATFLQLDAMPVAWRSLAELDSDLTERYRKQMSAIELSISITDRAPRAVSVLGEVESPGRYEVDEEVTFHEALALAGGFIRDTARLDQVLLLRWDSAAQTMRHWKFNAEVSQWPGSEPLRLQSDDIVYLPATAVVHVNDWIDRYIRRMIPLPSLVPATY